MAAALRRRGSADAGGGDAERDEPSGRSDADPDRTPPGDERPEAAAEDAVPDANDAEEPPPGFERPSLGDLSDDPGGGKSGRPELFERMAVGASDVRRDVARAGRAAASAARTAGGRISDGWMGLPLLTRQRIAAAAAFVVLVLFFVLVLIPNAPCWAPGGSACPPADDAIALVPADSDGYVHANLDPGTDQAQAATDIAGRLAGFSAVGAIGGDLLNPAAGRAINYRREIAPWSGGEIAMALTAGVGTHQPSRLDRGRRRRRGKVIRRQLPARAGDDERSGRSHGQHRPARQRRGDRGWLLDPRHDDGGGLLGGPRQR